MLAARMTTASRKERDMIRPTVAEIDCVRLRDNLRSIRHYVSPGVEVIGIVKADAYGHDAVRVAHVLEQEHVPLLAVATPDEAVELREHGISAEILVLGDAPPDFVPYATARNIALTTVSQAQTAAFSAAAGQRVVRLHYNVDTGMGRAGVLADGAARQILQGVSLPGVRLVGVYSHFASAESDPAFTLLQAQRLADVVQELRQGGFKPPMVHLANSAGLLASRAYLHDAVRPGILLYGCPPVPADACPVQPVLSLRTRITMVKELPVGHSIGYGRTFVASRPTRMALLPIGYGDGYPRVLSNRAHVIVHGHLAPVVGRISMDVCAIDVTDVPGAAGGDRVTLIGEQDGLRITADDLAALAGTISYEILTGIARRVPRVSVEHDH